MTAIIFDTEKSEIIETITKVKNVSVHYDFTAISYKDVNGEFEVKTIQHSPNTYITTI